METMLATGKGKLKRLLIAGCNPAYGNGSQYSPYDVDGGAENGKYGNEKCGNSGGFTRKMDVILPKIYKKLTVENFAVVPTTYGHGQYQGTFNSNFISFAISYDPETGLLSVPTHVVYNTTQGRGGFRGLWYCYYVE